MKIRDKVLIVEDEQNIKNFMSTILAANGFDTLMAGSAKEALSMISSHCPDLIILDLGLPDMDGMEVLKQVRAWSSVPVIVVSARTHEGDKVAALDLGADDYIEKPFGTSELLARIRTAVRHLTRINAANSTSHIFRASGLVIDFDRRRITVHEQEVHLTQVEYKIVSMLANNSGKVITYDALISHVWGPYADDNNRILRVNMANIRRKLERNPAQPEYIFTEIGIGYRMIDAEA